MRAEFTVSAILHVIPRQMGESTQKGKPVLLASVHSHLDGEGEGGMLVSLK